MSATIYYMWLLSYISNMVCVVLFKMHIFGDEVYLNSGDLPVCFFYVSVVYLGPIVSMVFFYSSEGSSSQKTVSSIAIWTLFITSLVINVAYAIHIFYPVRYGMGNSTLVGLYSDASTFAGYMIMTILSPFLSIVYATSK